MEKLRVLGCDHLNLARGKYLAGGKAAAGSTRLCRGLYAVTYLRDLLPAPGSMMLEGLPDMELVWQQEDIRPSWEDDTNVVVGGFFADAQTPLPMCGRGALKRAIADWQAMGYQPKVGIELEAFAFVREEDKLVPIKDPASYVYSTGQLADPIGFTEGIWESAHQLEFPLESLTTEYDAGQFEFVLTFDDALAAVDNIFLFKLMAREIALQYGVVLTFMPKPVPERGGNGIHVNFSLFDDDGNNAMSTCAEGGVDAMSELSKGCVAGLMEHHRALAGLIAPTVGSYTRLQPASMSGYWRNWGGDHRSVTVRVSSEGGSKARIEHRMGDSGANPYTMTAAVLQAARLGVVNQYQLPPPESGDGFENVGTDEAVGASLGDALNDLEADAAFGNALGAQLIANHAFIKRAEIAEVEACEDDIAKRDYYIHHI